MFLKIYHLINDTYQVYDEDSDSVFFQGSYDAAEAYMNRMQPDADEGDQFLSDSEADADALASIGWGTDEDYGDFGDDYM
jgi:hypothetical protein